jgi:hypothetical protein
VSTVGRDEAVIRGDPRIHSEPREGR